LAIELFCTIGIVAFFYIWYYTYYSKKVKTRTISQQRKLDATFKLLPAPQQGY
jgi:hypothetical protein